MLATAPAGWQLPAGAFIDFRLSSEEMGVWFEIECISCGHVCRFEGDEAWKMLHNYQKAANETDTELCDINSRIKIDGCYIKGCIPTWLKDEISTLNPEP